MKDRQTQKIIFLNSYLPRTGHNFVSEALKVFTDHQVLIHNKSETKLSTVLNKYFEISHKQVFFETDKNFLDHLFIDGLRDRILEKSKSNYVMIKDTSFSGVYYLPILFPQDIHIILIRDPYGVFNSLIKGMRFKKSSIKNFIKKVGISLGVYPYYYSKKISNQVLSQMPDLSNKFLLKYEDLVTLDESTLLDLKLLFGTNKPIQNIKDEIDDIEVINSSFVSEINAQNIWDRKPKTNHFNPVKRKGNSYLTRIGIKFGSRKLRKYFNYI